MAVRIAPFVTLPTRVNTETSFAPRPAPAAPVERDALFADGFSNRAPSPFSLGAPDPIAMPAFDLPSFKLGSIGEASARNFVSEEAEAPEQSEGKNPLEAGAERFEQGNTLIEQLNGAREFGEDFNLGQEARDGALESLNRDIEQYERVAPNLTGDRQLYAENLIADAQANRAELEALGDGTLGERAAGGLAELIEDSPLLSSLSKGAEVAGKYLGTGAGAIGAAFEGQELYENGDDLAMAEAGGLAQFGVGTVPGTQGIAAFDTLGKLGVEGAERGIEAATGLGNYEESEAIEGRGVFTDTAVDGARALVGLGEAAVTGDTSGLDNFRDSVDNGSLFERVLGTAGNFLGATAAAVETGSTQPFSDFADDTERAFSTLGEKRGAPEAAPSSEELSNPFSNYEAPREEPGAIPSYELNAPDLGFGESYGQDFVSDFEGGGGGGGGVAGAKEFTYSEE
ncbi:MAG: hypothetical protein QM723_16240 [Myxococcaceae bacterium]